MRYRHLILLAAGLSLAALLIVTGLALGENATAVPASGQAPQVNEPYRVQPLPREGMPAATSPAVQLPTATPMPVPTMKPTAMATTGGRG